MQTDQSLQNQTMTQEQMLQEIYVNSRKTKNYMKWQLIITIALVVIPILAMVVVVPLALSSLTSLYSTSGLLQ